MRLIAGILMVALLTPLAFVRGGEKGQSEDEARQVAKEIAEEEKLGEDLQVLFTGKVILTPKQEEHPDVVGVFQYSGHSFLLKLDKKDLLTTLKTCNRKEVTLVGRPRNKGKYFLAWGIELSGAAPVHTRTRGSL